MRLARSIQCIENAGLLPDAPCDALTQGSNRLKRGQLFFRAALLPGRREASEVGASDEQLVAKLPRRQATSPDPSAYGFRRLMALPSSFPHGHEILWYMFGHTFISSGML
jgi:hypothetical protein